MGDIQQRHEDNASGLFYVDGNCVLCNVCIEMAPAHFQMADAGDHAIVHTQPATDEARALCAEAMEGCPMDAVGDDG